MSNKNCSACDDLKNTAPSLIVNGMTDTECTSLKNNTGLSPSSGHDDCTDLNNLNDCLIGNLESEIEAYDVCEWKPFMQKFIPNVWTTMKGVICAVCGIWTNITNLWSTLNKLIRALGGDDASLPVVRKYSYTVPAAKFIPFATVIGASGSVIQWFSGSPGMDECYIDIPVADMDTVVGVWAQTRVVVDRANIQSVAIQQAYRVGDVLRVNFDTYELQWDGGTGYPYDLEVDFLVVGRKRLV